MALLELRGLTKSYTRGGRAFNAVDRANVSVAAGDFVSITGRSGSGKSTLLNMAAGLLKPTAGTVLFNGDDIARYNDRAVSLFRNEKTGCVPQGQSLLANFTVLENVCIPWFLRKRAGDPEERALTLLENVGIGRLAAAYPKELSGGEMRRAAIARALINNPPLLIADEPTGDLDGETTVKIMNLLNTLAGEGTAVLIVTHEADTLNYGTVAYSMNAGILTLLPQEKNNTAVRGGTL
ncbi:MAG: ABC transporter ATP-binding protein [Spirochaetaceae bacterium]|jgi:putative ABC transport system ATP-binding protein|nr:ABC transporter ATP-binding protein [Spirochaetaceae bacterium]